MVGFERNQVWLDLSNGALTMIPAGHGIHTIVNLSRFFCSLPGNLEILEMKVLRLKEPLLRVEFPINRRTHFMQCRISEFLS